MISQSPIEWMRINIRCINTWISDLIRFGVAMNLCAEQQSNDYGFDYDLHFEFSERNYFLLRQFIVSSTPITSSHDDSVNSH